MSADAELLAAVADGDRAALRTLYDDHAPWLAVRLARRCADPGLVDETVQDTFVRVWCHADTYRGEGEVGAWIWGIAIRRLIDRLRKRRPMPVDVTEQQADEVLTSVEDRVLVGVAYERLGPALQALSPELQATLRARVLDGLSTREAAELLGVAPGTVKSRLHRARRQLREALA